MLQRTFRRLLKPSDLLILWLIHEVHSPAGFIAIPANGWNRRRNAGPVHFLRELHAVGWEGGGNSSAIHDQPFNRLRFTVNGIGAGAFWRLTLHYP